MSLPKALTATQKATKGIQTALKQVQDAIKLLDNNVELDAALLESMAEKQEALAAIEQDTAIKLREAKVELDLRVKENEDNVLATLLESRSLANISSKDLADLNSLVTSLSADNEAAISAAVEAAKQDLVQQHAIVIRELTSEHKVKTAQLEATIQSQEDYISHMQSTNATLQETIKAEREARVAESEARAKASGATVNVTK